MTVECCGVRCNLQGLAELHDGTAIVEVRKDALRLATLRHGLQAPHPVLQLLMGGALIALGYFPAMHLIEWFRRGGTFLAFEAFAIPFVFLGVTMVFTALRRGDYLELESRDGRKRLSFRPRPDPAQLKSFLDEAEQCLGMRIEREA